MTIYLTDQPTKQDIINAKNSGFIFGAKLYPSGVTTNSQFGVTSITPFNISNADFLSIKNN